MKKCLLILILSASLLPIQHSEIKSSNYMVKQKQSILPPSPGGTPSFDGTPNSDGLVQTQCIDLAHYKNILVGMEYATSTYKSGLIDNYYNFKVNSIKGFKGVYSHFDNYVAKGFLESGSYNASFNQTFKYAVRTNESLFFQETVSGNLEVKLSASFSLNTSDLKSDIQAESDGNYKYEAGYGYSSRKSLEQTSSFSFNINGGIAKYCPNNYAITIGMVAEYYILELSYRNVVKTWIKEQKDKYTDLTMLIVDESKLFETFVYINTIGSPVNTYYLP